MNQKMISQYEGKANIFKALSHPTRLFILHTIKDKPYSVSELAKMTEIDISTMSRHLDLLKRYQIITGQKEKNTVYYRLNIPCLFEFMDCAQKIVSCPSDCSAISCMAVDKK